MAINNKGYSINTEEFDEKQCNTMSRFLSYFKKEELDKDTVNTLKVWLQLLKMQQLKQQKISNMQESIMNVS